MEEPRPQYVSGKKWAIHSSTVTSRVWEDCIYFNGVKSFCQQGGIANAFESADGKYVIINTAGASIESFQERYMAVFEIESGKKIRKVSIKGGGPMVAVANPIANLFVAYYEDVGGVMVLQAFDMVGNLKWRREIKDRSTPVVGTESLAISADGKKIFLATIPFPLKPNVGSILIITDAGEIAKELPIGSRRMRLSPDKKTLALWNKKEYQVYSIVDDQIVLQESCSSGRYSWCVMGEFSSDGKYLTFIDVGEDRTEKKIKITRVDFIDLSAHMIYQDYLNEEVDLDVKAKFKANTTLEIQSRGKTISYETIP